MTNIVLALDLGTTTGYAFGDKADPDIVLSGFENFAPGKFGSAGMRFLKFERWLQKVISQNTVSEIVFEGVRRHIGVDAAHVYGGFMATLQKTCETMALPLGAVGVGTIKKFATGKGNADKATMISAVQSWGYTDVVNDNQADAIALLHQWFSAR